MFRSRKIIKKKILPLSSVCCGVPSVSLIGTLRPDGSRVSQGILNESPQGRILLWALFGTLKIESYVSVGNLSISLNLIPEWLIAVLVSLFSSLTQG